MKLESRARRAAWNVAKIFMSSTNKDKTTFYSLVEIKAPIFISKTPDERMFVVDSGDSMHMLSNRDLGTILASS